MNKAILMGRVVRDCELRYTQGQTPLAVATYTLVVNRRFKKAGQPDADFINCVAFGKAAEFAGNYFKKGMMVSVVGSIQISEYEKDGQKRKDFKVVVDEQYFAESKKKDEAGEETKADFVPVSADEDDLPF